MAEEKVKVRVKPLHGIGGFGDAGHEGWMLKSEAEQYEAEGYVEILPPSPALPPNAKSTNSGEGGEPEDHKVMKPAKKRSKRKAKK